MSMIPGSSVGGVRWERRADSARIIHVETLKNFYLHLNRGDKWKPLGSGAFGEAWGRGNLVWKINLSATFISPAKRRSLSREERQRTFTSEIRESACGDGYIAYAQAIVLKVMRSVHAPRIFLILIDDMGRYAVLMERLRETLSQFHQRYDVNERERMSVDSVHRNACRFAYTQMGEHSEIREEESAPLSLKKILGDIVIHFGRDYGLDLHSGNFMFRYDGQIVVSDPLSYMERDSETMKLVKMAVAREQLHAERLRRKVVQASK